MRGTLKIIPQLANILLTSEIGGLDYVHGLSDNFLKERSHHI